MAEVGTAFVSILPATKGFGSSMSRQIGGDVSKAGTSSGKTFGKSFSKSGSSRIASFGSSIKGLIGPAIAVAGAAAAVGFVKGAIGEAREAQKVGAQTEAVLKSTGKAAGVSSGHVADLANAISLKTGIDDEAIQSGENLLLTFTNVRNEVGKGNDIFDQATQTVTDMSAALGQDTKSSAIQLGKALNDPVKGITALSRVGVSFTEQQKEQIKTLVENGDTLKAQKIIVGELGKEFGGSAAAQATAGDKAKVAFDNLKETVGTALLPVLDNLFNFFSQTAIPALLNLGKITTSSGGKFSAFAAVAKQAFEAVVGFIRDNMGTVKDIISSTTQLVKDIWSRFGDNIVAQITIAWNAVKGIIRGALKIIEGIIKVASGIINGDWSLVWEGIKDIVRGAFDIIKTIVKTAIAALKNEMSAGWKLIKGLAGDAWEGIKQIVSDGAQNIVDAVKAIPGRIKAVGGAFKDAGKSLIDSMLSGIANAGSFVTDIAGNVYDAVKGLLNGAIDQINASLEFKIDLPGPDIHVNPTNIPHLARGGYATRATLAVIGEGKEPESVLPDSVLRGLLTRTAQQAQTSGGRMFGDVTVQAHDYQDFMTQMQRRSRSMAAARG